MKKSERKKVLDDIMLMVVGAVCALAGILVISNYFYISSNNSIRNINSGDIMIKKSQILAMVEEKTVLTPAQKAMISAAIIGNKVKMYNFTDQEINEIITVFNKN